MSERGFQVRLSARVDQYVAAMETAKRSTMGLSKETERNLNKVGAQMQGFGRNMTTFVSLPLAGLGVGAAAAAVQWESAWAGVTKTVDGTTQQMAGLEDGLRSMAKELPATHGEIAAVAEAAGALGIQTDSILGFTRTMIDLGETTNLTADQAATSFARIANVMGTAHSEFDRMGSTVVALGNNGASTEAEIVELANRLAAAGAIAGLSEADVFAFAETLASVGVEAEAGGTALSKVFTAIRDSVLDGSDKLTTFARVAGVSASEFATAFETDAAGAIAMFIEGLGRISASGQSTTRVFEELELTDQRLMRALLSTGEAGDYLRGQIDLANTAWVENNALQDEAQKRYETTAAQLGMLRNKAVDVGISLGEQMAPALGFVIDLLGGALEAFDSLPGPIKAIIVGFAGLVAAIGPAVWITGTYIKSFKELRAAMIYIQTQAAMTSTAIAGLSLAMGAAAAAFAGWTVVKMRDAQQMQHSIDLYNELGRVAEEEIAGTLATAMAEGFLAGRQIDDQLAEFARTNIEAAIRVREYMKAQSEADAENEDARRLYEALAAAIEGEKAAQERQAATTAAAAAEMDAAGQSAIRFDGIMNQVRDSLGGVADATEDVETRLDGVGGRLEHSLEHSLDGLDSVISGVLDMGTSIVAEFHEWKDAINSSFDSGRSAANRFSEDATRDVAKFREELAANILALAEWQDNLVSIGSQTTSEFAAYLASLGPEFAGVVDQMEGSEDDLAAAFGLWVELTKQTGRDMATEMEIGGKEAALSGSKALMAEVGNQTKTQSSSARSSGSAIGGAFVEGMATGIDGNVSIATSAVVRATNAMVAAARTNLKIFSPSKVMAELVGLPMVQGIAQGFIDGSPYASIEAALAAKKITKKVADEMRDAVRAEEEAQRMAERVGQAMVRAFEDQHDLIRDAAADMLRGAEAAVDEAWKRMTGRLTGEDLRKNVTDAQRALDDARTRDAFAQVMMSDLAYLSPEEAAAEEERWMAERRDALADMAAAEDELKRANMRLFDWYLDQGRRIGDPEVQAAGIAAGFTPEELSNLQAGMLDVHNAQWRLNAVTPISALVSALPRSLTFVIDGHEVTAILDERDQQLLAQLAAGG